MKIVISKILVLGVLIANELLPVTAKLDLPRSNNGLRVRLTSGFPDPLLVPKRGYHLPEQYDNSQVRKSEKVYVITLDPSNLESSAEKPVRKPLRYQKKNNDDWYRRPTSIKILPVKSASELPVALKKAVLPIEKILDQNGMLYLTKPKGKRVKKMLEENDLVGKLRSIIDEELANSKKNEKADKPQVVYAFDELVE